MKKLALSVLFAISLFANNLPNLNNTKDIRTNFENTFNGVVKIVLDKTFNKEERNAKIVKLLTPMFDFKLMAKLSLGRYWKKLNKQTKDKFTKIYVKRMKKSYSSKLDNYTNQKIIINSIKNQISKKSGKVLQTRMILDSTFLNNGEKFQVSYKYYKPKKPKKLKQNWLIYDVILSGVSIIKTDKAQFKEALQGSSIQDLMEQLEK